MAEGYCHVAAYLDTLDLSAFDPKSPPPKTQAFWDIVDSNRAPGDAEMADVIDALGNPEAVTLVQIRAKAKGEFFEWLCERKNRRVVPHRFEACSYAPVRTPDAKDGAWKIQGERQTVKHARAQGPERGCPPSENQLKGLLTMTEFETKALELLQSIAENI